jgi:hypothetical protein
MGVEGGKALFTGFSMSRSHEMGEPRLMRVRGIFRILAPSGP